MKPNPCRAIPPRSRPGSAQRTYATRRRTGSSVLPGLGEHANSRQRIVGPSPAQQRGHNPAGTSPDGDLRTSHAARSRPRDRAKATMAARYVIEKFRENARRAAVISRPLWSVYDVADEGYLFRRGHVVIWSMSRT